MHKPKCVLVSDSNVQRSLETAQLLRQAGYEVLENLMIEEQLLDDSARINLILLSTDQLDPRIYALCSRLKLQSTGSQIPLVLRVGRDSISNLNLTEKEKFAEDEQVRAIQAGADAYLQSSVSAQTLLCTVKAWTRMHQSHTDTRIQSSDLELHAILMQVPIPLVILKGPEHRYVFANPAYERVSGRKVVGRTVREAFPEQVSKTFLPILDKVYRTGISHPREEFQVQLSDPNGILQEIWINVEYTPLRDNKGNVVGILALPQNITEQVEARQEAQTTAKELAIEQHQLETIFELSPAGIAILRGKDLVFEKVNAEFQKIFGYRDLVGRSLLQALPELSDHPYRDLLLNVYETGEPVFSHEVMAKLKLQENAGTHERYYNFSSVPVKNSDGKPDGVYNQIFDVTESVLARKKLEQSEEKLKLAMKTGQIGFFDRNIELDQSVISDQLISDWGLTGENPFDIKRIMDLVHPEDREQFLKAINESIENRTPYWNQYRVVRPDGKIVWIESRGSTIYDQNNKPVRIFGTSTDITKMRVAAEELKDAKERAELANRAKTVFLANMSHEIRSPLAAIMGFIGLLKDVSLPEEAVDFLSIIDRNSAHLTRLIDDILDLSKVEAGKMEIEKIKFSLGPLLADVGALMEFKAREKGLSFDLTLSTSIPSHILSDPTRIRQVLSNALGNAIKFTDRGRVQLVCSYKKQKLQFVMTDTGCGISKKQASRLFQPFSQSDPSTTREYGGTGLGLVLSKRICQQMGGDFYLAQSEPQVGSIFIAEMEVEPALGSTLLSTLNQLPNEKLFDEVVQKADFKDLKILLVEDSPDNQALVKILLKKCGAQIESAFNGREAIDLALRHHYDLILMDIQMPYMDGHETTKLLRKLGYQTPIIALTAHAMNEERDRTLESGFSDFLAKPIHRDRLFQVLRKHSQIKEPEVPLHSE